MYADILTEYSAKAIDQTFTYKVPERLLGKLKKGMKVLTFRHYDKKWSD